MTNAPASSLVGYARVSTTRQNLDRQTDALGAAGAQKVFADKVTGRTMDRPQWAACRDYLRPGDTLLVDNLDRLGRSTLEVITTVTELTDAGIVVQSIAQGTLDPSTATGRLMIGMFAMLAEFEVDLKAERASSAREAAAARGQHTGRPRKLAKSDAVRARELRDQGMSAGEVGKVLGCSRATIYRYLAT
ncbi:recombinase family protein [Rhodococcoides yunnanense]|uniref:recombinase family protein n=1 Tax=Rhodococcoides yunnanense TaxID=278209 RepID=UPI000934A382|nr:recombinase family protein [Rhodococcus yunnanensis]